MNIQMIPNATEEMAMGMKISDFTMLSYRTRSKRTARIRPNTRVKTV